MRLKVSKMHLHSMAVILIVIIISSISLHAWNDWLDYKTMELKNQNCYEKKR